MTEAVFDLVPLQDEISGIGSGICNPDADNDRNPSIPIAQAPMFHVAGDIERIPSDDSSTTSSTSSSSQPSPVVIPTPGAPSKEMASIINR